MDRMKVGARIRALRGARRMTAKDLETATGLSVDVISRTERGLIPICVDRLEVFGSALGVSASDLLAETFTVEL